MVKVYDEHDLQQIENLALERLLDRIDDVVDHVDNDPKTRTIFSQNQVLNLAEIEVGAFFRKCGAWDGTLVEIMSKPYSGPDKNRSLQVVVRYHFEDSTFDSTMFLGDCGVVPYITDSGEILWNNYNWLERASKEKIGLFRRVKSWILRNFSF